MLILKIIAEKLRPESVLNTQGLFAWRISQITVTHVSHPIDIPSRIDLVLNSWESMSAFCKKLTPRH